jgi:Tol biopolymer transport system component
MSGDGQFVAFASLGSNLSPSDANNQSDVFLRDRSAGTTTRVSVGTGGSDADGSSYRPSISGDGSFVAFCSRASNLVADDTNGVADAFLWERTTGAITRIPVPGTTQAASDGCLSVSADNDGGVVAFSAVTGGTAGVFVYDRASGSTTAVTDGADGPSGTGGVAISGDGGVVIFDSLADNLVDNDTNRSRDVFARDRAAGTMSRVSVRSSGSQLPGDSGASGVGVSRDGRFAVFGSTARGVVQGDTNGFEDVFRRDLTSGETTIVSVNATDLSANNPSYSPAVNADGSQVVYTSLATNVVTGDGNRQPDVFVRGGTFPDRVGTSTEPEDTGAPQESDQTVVVGQDDGGLPRALLIGGIALGLAVVLAGGWLLLGRRGRA